MTALEAEAATKQISLHIHGTALEIMLYTLISISIACDNFATPRQRTMLLHGHGHGTCSIHLSTEKSPQIHIHTIWMVDNATEPQTLFNNRPCIILTVTTITITITHDTDPSGSVHNINLIQIRLHLGINPDKIPTGCG